MIDPVSGYFDHKLDPPAEPVTATCDACGGLGFHGCDLDCGDDCFGNHWCVVCDGTGRLAAAIGGCDDGDAKRDARSEMRRGL
jgi:hypothetical protein